MVIMATKPKRMSVFKTMMRRRTFTKWSNLLLRSIDRQIVDIFNANERELLDRLLEIVLKESVKKFKDTTEGTRLKQWGLILEKAETFKGNYFKETQCQGNSYLTYMPNIDPCSKKMGSRIVNLHD